MQREGSTDNIAYYPSFQEMSLTFYSVHLDGMQTEATSEEIAAVVFLELRSIKSSLLSLTTRWNPVFDTLESCVHTLELAFAIHDSAFASQRSPPELVVPVLLMAGFIESSPCGEPRTQIKDRRTRDISTETLLRSSQ